MSLSLSILIPSYQRPEFLAKALRGLKGQTRAADQIVIGTRADDELTQAFLEQGGAEGLPVETATTLTPGVIASMTAALAQTRGDVVCLLDDDAEPLPDWLAKIERRFSENPRLGILGGRDLLQDHPEMRRNESTTQRVGKFEWTGRMIGNHHRGSGGYRPADLVKGCNAAVRGDLLREVGFETRLRGKGAQVHWELALCLDVAKRGFAVAYDSDLQVIHHIAPRRDADLIHRGFFSAEGLRDMVWNEHFIVTTRCGWTPRTMHRLWSIFVGSRTAPGFLQALRLMREGDPHLREKLRITLQAIHEARHSAKESFLP